MEILPTTTPTFRIVNNDDQNNANIATVAGAAGATSLVLTPDQVTDMIQHHQGIDLQMQQMLNKKRSLLSRLHPSELDKVLENAKLQVFKQSANHMLCINDCLHQTYLRQLRAVCSANTKAVEVMMSAHLTNTLANAYTTLLKKMAGIKEETDQYIIRECKSIENIPVEKYRALREANMDKHMARTCEFYDYLLEQFVATMKANGISLPGTPLVK